MPHRVVNEFRLGIETAASVIGRGATAGLCAVSLICILLAFYVNWVLGLIAVTMIGLGILEIAEAGSARAARHAWRQPERERK